MELKLSNPAVVTLPEVNDQVKRFLTFDDRSVQYQLNKLRKNYRWRGSDPDSFERRMNELKEKSKRCLLFDDPETGMPSTYSGLHQDLNNAFGWHLERPVYDYTKVRPLPWAKEPHKMRYYQEEAVEALLKAQHGGIELPTGAGKSLVILNLCKRVPVRTLIVTPSKAITNQLYKDFITHFGKKYVGKYGDGKKEIGKLFTVAVAHSLVRLEEGTEAWDFFKDVEMVIWDESHTTPAETFDSVCMGVVKNSPLRFFCSATQLRGDGSELLLRGITGPIVYRKDFKELVEEGYLKRPIFKVFNVPSYGPHSGDIGAETRQQLYLNPNVNRLAAEIAFKAINLANRQTVIIIDEFKQFMVLKNYITVPFEFVHGGASDREDASGTKLRDYLPKEYWESDTEGAIKRFNEGKTKLIIGTSAISTGVDLKPVGCLIYLQGGMSEIKVKQAIGRGTRKVDGIDDFWVVDFKTLGSSSMERHTDERIGIYETMGEVTEHTVES